jgi:hypothetical protein
MKGGPVLGWVQGRVWVRSVHLYSTATAHNAAVAFWTNSKYGLRVVGPVDLSSKTGRWVVLSVRSAWLDHGTSRAPITNWMVGLHPPAPHRHATAPPGDPFPAAAPERPGAGVIQLLEVIPVVHLATHIAIDRPRLWDMTGCC